MRKDKGLHSHLIFIFFVFFVVEEDGERRRRRNRQDCIFNGKSKDKNRRELNNGEGKTKQGTEKMGLFFIDPLSLISPFPFLFEIRKTKRKNYEKRRMVRKGTEEIGREEGHDEAPQGSRARSHPLLTLPLLYHTSSFLVFYSVIR